MFTGPIRPTPIVGYQNLDTRSSGLTMSTPTFIPVGASSVKLSDVTVSGYEAPYYDADDDWWYGGVEPGTFVLRLLTGTGTSEATYYWIDDPNKGKSAGWYADMSGNAIDGGASSVVIEQGRGLWITGNGLKLTCAGEVETDDVLYSTRSVGLSATGNCTPVDLTLGKLFVEGYTAPYYDADDDWWYGGVEPGTFVLRLLTGTGTSEATYYWIDDPNKGISAGWYTDMNGTAIDGGATSVSIVAGKGLWVTGNGLKLHVPAPELN